MTTLFPLVTPANIGLNNLVAKETYAEIPKKTSIDRLGSPSPTEKSKYNLWPILKRAVPTNIMETGKPLHTLTISQSTSSLRDYQSTPKSADAAKSKGYPESSLLERRKVNFSDLGIAPMATVHEYNMDSPTIPGRFPLHERSNSAPGSSSRVQLENTFLEGESAIVFPDDDDEVIYLDYDQSDGSSASSPSSANTETESKSSQSSGESTPKAIPVERTSDTPPAVPPKSPRMAARSSPALQQFPASKFNLPTRQGSPRIVADKKINNASTNSESMRTNHITSQWQRPSLRPRAATTTDVREPPNVNLNNHQRSESASAGLRDLAPVAEEGVPGKKVHLGRSVMDRGRPVRRHARDGNKGQTPSGERGGSSSIPPGMSHSEARSLLSPTHVERIQYKARLQAEKFSVLAYDDVKSLSRELRVLDERYEYLRETHKSLRTGRNESREKMIHFLRSPGVNTSCREALLRQEEALADLDKSIDDWVLKLEQVENRRTRVRQKLLEHIAAALLLQVSSEDRIAEQQTPPRSPASPEKDIEAEFNRKESIKIYADSKVFADAKVCALFKDIETEMELMKQGRYSSLPQDVPNPV